jgi:flagellar basal-body rod protein FlgC
MRGANISATGLSAERTRMEVVASNIANANTTRTTEGGPYRRREVLFEALLARSPAGHAGVRVAGVVPDGSDFQRVHEPGHPDANAEGYVLRPNVSPPLEMVNLLTAMRGYEANLKALQALRQQLEQTLLILRS